MKIYTRRGDEGETGLFGGGRVSKDHRRVRAYGTVDELNAALGRALLRVEVGSVAERLGLVQHDLFAVGAVLATPPAAEGRSRPDLPEVPAYRVEEMEAWIDEATESLEPLHNFVVPGGGPGGAELHVCRTVCRRAERSVVALAEEAVVEPAILAYLNRLSDLLFVFARLENREAGTGDVIWRPPEPREDADG